MKIFVFIIFFLVTQCLNVFCHSISDDQKNLPFEYKVIISDKIEGSITKEEIIKAKTLLLDKDAPSIYYIKSFKMTLVCKGSDILEFENSNSGELSPPMVESIKNAKAGCKLYFEFIRIENNKNHLVSEKFVPALSFVLK